MKKKHFLYLFLCCSSLCLSILLFIYAISLIFPSFFSSINSRTFNCTFELERHECNLLVEAEDSLPESVCVLKFSRDGEEFSDYVVMKSSQTGFSVLYYNDSDTLYILTSEVCEITNKEEKNFIIALAQEVSDGDEYSADNINLWKVDSTMWFKRGVPRLSPKAKTKKLYIRHRLLGAKTNLDYRTIFLQTDTNCNITIFPSL